MLNMIGCCSNGVLHIVVEYYGMTFGRRLGDEKLLYGMIIIEIRK
jgi:hypothetical protein